MTQERDTSHAHDSQTTPSPRDHDDVAPGRRTRSEQLVAPDRPMPSGILQRKRDGNGVEAEADAAVASAMSSTGSPLPSGLMRKFESSLGADLSGVRVHTDGESATAAAAVGAKAYTLGQDIHFAGGHFDPASPSGEHLLAHEVAHTVQQAGGIGRRAQFKLEVSAPGDHHELEADRAADAMVSGAPAIVTGASGLARDIVQRELAFPTDTIKAKAPNMSFPPDKINNKDVDQKNKNVAAGANELRSRAMERIIGQAMKTQAAIEAFHASASGQIEAMVGVVDEAWDVVEPMLELAGGILETFFPALKSTVKVIDLFTKGFAAGYETGKVVAKDAKKDAKAAMDALAHSAATAKEKTLNALTAPLDKCIADMQFGKDDDARKLLGSHQPDDIGRLCDRIVIDPMKKSPYEQTLSGLGQKFAAWRVRSEFRAKHTKFEAMAIEADPNSAEHKKLDTDIAEAQLEARKEARKSAEAQNEPGTSTFPVW